MSKYRIPLFEAVKKADRILVDGEIVTKYTSDLTLYLRGAKGIWVFTDQAVEVCYDGSSLAQQVNGEGVELMFLIATFSPMKEPNK